MKEEVYARVENGVVVDYPVYLSMIRKRNHNVSDYYIVKEKEKPIVDFYHKLEPYFQITDKYKFVYIKYNVVQKSQSEIEKDLENLKKIYKENVKKELLALLNDSFDNTNNLTDEKKSRSNFFSPSLNIEVNFGYAHINTIEMLINTIVEENQRIQFRKLDNTYVELTKSQLQTLLQEMKNHVIYLHQKKFEIEQLIEEAVTYEDLMKVNKSLR